MPDTAAHDASRQAIWLGLARISRVLQHPELTALGNSEQADGFSDSERQRLQGITAPRRRAQFIAGRWLLRQVLRRLLPGQTFSVTASTDGPPRLIPGPAEERKLDAFRPSWHLALSHSGDWVCCAVAPVAIGLDMETTEGRSPRDWPNLAQAAGTPEEQAELAALSEPSAQGRRFLALWTLKEAWFKQQALGLDWALLPRLRTVPASESDTAAHAAHARVWQNADHTLALTTDAANMRLPVRWMPMVIPAANPSSGHEVPDLSSTLTELLPQLWRIERP